MPIRPRCVRLPLLLLLLPAACGWPSRFAAKSNGLTQTMSALAGFADVRAADGYPDPTFQASFEQTLAAFAQTPLPSDGRRDFDMLVLSSGGVNGAFGAGVLTEWSKRGDRPVFWVVTGVSVGALMAPFAFAGQHFDARLEHLFRWVEPGSMHHEKGMISSVLWDESLADNTPLHELVDQAVDEELMNAVADRHAEGRRCLVGSTNLDIGQFCIWDLGAIASRRTPAALLLMRKVMIASASVPVVYPPVRFEVEAGEELHADGAVVRPMFIPQNVFDGYLAADRVGLNWDDVDATLYLVHNGSLRPPPVDVQRDTLAIAMRTVTMMSYQMVSEHVLHLYMLTRAWQARFRFHTMPDGLDLSLDSFSREDTNRLFLLGAGMMQRREAWSEAPPGYIVRTDLERIQPRQTTTPPASEAARLDRIEAELRGLRDDIRALRGQ